MKLKITLRGVCNGVFCHFRLDVEERKNSI